MKLIQSLLTVIIFSINTGLTQPADSAMQIICTYPGKVSTREEFIITINLKLNQEKRLIKISTIPEYGFKDDVDADMYFMVQKRVDSDFVDCMPTVDYQNIYMERPLKQVTGTGTFRLGEFTLPSFYYFSKGEYRFKVVARLSRFNKGVADTESEWCKVEATRDLWFLP